jgi:hypothetical protein
MTDIQEVICDYFDDGTKAFVLCYPWVAPALADVNCDGAVNGLDIQPFVLAILDPDAYAAAYPACDIYNADLNADCVLDTADVTALVSLLLGG